MLISIFVIYDHINSNRQDLKEINHFLAGLLFLWLGMMFRQFSTTCKMFKVLSVFALLMKSWLDDEWSAASLTTQMFDIVDFASCMHD